MGCRGYRLFPSSNVPSKAFAEIIEHECATPAISAEELDRLRRSGQRVIVLDSRPLEEYARFHVPGAVPCPGAELVHRFADAVPSPDTLVVVLLRRAHPRHHRRAIPDQRRGSEPGDVARWRHAGLASRRVRAANGLGDGLRPVSAGAAAAARRRTAAVEVRFGIPRIDRATLSQWQVEADRRTTHVLDVRTSEEFAAGHLPGSVSAPGGQLVQAIDRWVGTCGARLVLVDDDGTRAIMTAHWLKQLGWDVQVLDRALDGAALETGSAVPGVSSSPSVPAIQPAEAARLLAAGAAGICLEPSAAYRQAHPQGAVWSVRPRLDRLPAAILKATGIIMFSADEAATRLAAVDLAELGGARIMFASGGTQAWSSAGLPVVASPGDPPDAERIDYLFWNHDRHTGNRDAMQAYLRWETELPDQIAAEGLAGFNLGPH